MSFTPGPWGYELSGGYYEIAPYGCDYPDDCLRVTHERCLDWSREVAATADANEANAQLMAASPNLLEACEAALPALRWYRLRMSGNELHGRDVCEQLEAAIRRARGEQGE